MNLQDQGFRFVIRGARATWVHPAKVLPSDLDCTDMTDAQFEEAVRVSITY